MNPENNEFLSNDSFKNIINNPNLYLLQLIMSETVRQKLN